MYKICHEETNSEFVKKKVAFTIKFFEVLFSDVGNFLYRTYQALFFSCVCLLFVFVLRIFFFFCFFLTCKRRQSCSELAQTCPSTGKTHTTTLLFFSIFFCNRCCFNIWWKGKKGSAPGSFFLSLMSTQKREQVY